MIYISRYKEEFIYLFMLILGSSNKFLTPVALIGVLFYSVYLGKIYSIKQNYRLAQLVIFVLLFQNVGIAIGAKIFTNHDVSLSLLTQVPTMVIVVYGFMMLLNNKFKLSNFDKLYLMLVVVVVFYFFVSDFKIVPKLTYARNFLIFYFGVYIGMYTLINSENWSKFTDYVVKLGLLASVIGLVSVFFGLEWYKFFGAREVYIAKRNSPYSDTLPANFTTVFAGFRVNRIASLYYDPVNFGYFSAFSLVIVLTNLKKYSKFLVIFLSTLFFTFGKGGQLIFLSLLGCYFLYQLIRKLFRFDSLRSFLLTVFIYIVGVTLLVTIIQLFFPNSFGTKMHFYGISTSIEYFIKKPFGYGLGSAGNIVQMDNDLKDYIATETALFNMLFQIGIIPFMILIVIYLKFSFKIFITKTLGNNKIVAFVPVIILVVSAFQENAFSPQCVIPFMLIVGANLNVKGVNNDKN